MASVWRDSDLQYDVAAGHWVRNAIESASKNTVVSLVPVGFEAYGRVLEPVQSVDEGGYERWLRWADVARATGAIAHASMELETMLEFSPEGYVRSTPIVPESPVPPWQPQQLIALSEVLAQHTTTPEHCWFGFWKGNTAFAGIPLDVPKLTVEGFRYYLLRGPVARAADTFHGLEAHLWRPDDRAWYVATHFDFPCAYLGGSTRCIDDVLNTDSLEAWPAATLQQITVDSDLVNTELLHKRGPGQRPE
ncbi:MULTISPECIES: hypothetical protein [unclassified Rhodococcus (in: high G+C Gram-positive bacteria)]|uniref:hypothetical protein n=1 Tax=unclassified Rhodococcus (in: high G+C Gram-positive bacteria) TaxID=192944 RepID=UPI000304050A|nr:hypothetical protein [Rhodococcus sp. DK17]